MLWKHLIIQITINEVQLSTFCDCNWDACQHALTIQPVLTKETKSRKSKLIHKTWSEENINWEQKVEPVTKHD